MEFDHITVLLLFGLAAVGLLLYRRTRYLSNINGPKGWPLVGNAFQMDSLHPHLTLTSWAQQYGDVYAINLFGKQVVVVNGDSELREVLVTKSRDFAGRPQHFRTSYMRAHGMESVAFLTYTPRWRARKKLFSNNLRMYGDGLQRLEEISNNIIADLIKAWHSKQGVSFDPRDGIHYATINVILSLLFGHNLKADDPLLKEMVHYHTTVSTEVFSPTSAVELDLFPWLRFFGHSIFKKMKVYRDEYINGTLKGLIDKNRKNVDPDNPKCVLHSLMLEINKIKKITGEEGNDVINLDIVRALITESFGAGTQTTSSTLLSLIGQITVHQDFQDRLRSHIQDVIGDKQPLLKDRPRLPLVEALILEVLRLTTVIPTAIPHVTTQCTSVGGVQLPKGVLVWTNLWSLHHDERYWKDPWTFNPDRFLDNYGQLVPPDHPNRKRLLPFSAGHRVCMGESLARNRLFLFVTSLVQHFRFLPGDTPPNCDPRVQKLGLVLYPPAYSIRMETFQ